jgi:hypothetical protein
MIVLLNMYKVVTIQFQQSSITYWVLISNISRCSHVVFLHLFDQIFKLIVVQSSNAIQNLQHPVWKIYFCCSHLKKPNVPPPHLFILLKYELKRAIVWLLMACYSNQFSIGNIDLLFRIRKRLVWQMWEKGWRGSGSDAAWDVYFLRLYKEDRQRPTLPSGKEGDDVRSFFFRYVIWVQTLFILIDK